MRNDGEPATLASPLHKYSRGGGGGGGGGV